MSASVIEVILLRWNEGPTGRTVSFLLPEDTTQHPFRGLKCGPSNGQRLALSVALIHDDESQTAHEPEQPSHAPQTPADGLKANGASSHRLAQKAGILCREGAFTQFLMEKYADYLALDEDGEPDAAATLRHYCGIRSRRDLDTNASAASYFSELASKYAIWRQGLD